MVADTHHFEEEMDPDPHYSKMLVPDPDRHQNDADPYHCKKEYTHKTSGFKTSGTKRLVSKRLKRQVYKTSALQNVRVTKYQVYKTTFCKPDVLKPDVLKPDVLKPDVLKPDVLWVYPKKRAIRSASVKYGKVHGSGSKWPKVSLNGEKILYLTIHLHQFSVEGIRKRMTLLLVVIAPTLAAVTAGILQSRELSPDARQEEGKDQLGGSQRVQMACEKAGHQPAVVQPVLLPAAEPLRPPLRRQQPPFQRDEGHL